MSQIKGQIISGSFDEILVRQKNNAQIELGELLIAENNEQKTLFQTFDIGYGSQISQQNLELISGMYLEEEQPIELYEENLRNYTVAKLKAVLTIPKDNNTKSTKQLPNVFSTVREVTKEDFTFLRQATTAFTLGELRSGSTKHDVPISLPTRDVLSHHILIAATTGKGKSNLMKVMLFDLLAQTANANLILDPHDEYYGRNGIGLKDHPKWNQCGSYYTATKPPNGALSLKIHISLLKPKHFQGVLDFSHPQMELMYAYYSAYGENWIENLLKKDTTNITFEFHEGTFGVVERRIAQLLDIRFNHTQNELVCKGIFDAQLGKTILSDIAQKLENAQSVIIDTSSIAGASEIFVSSILTNAIFDKYRYFQKEGVLHTKPVVSIVLEEAPRVIGKEVLERGQNVFSTIAKEGRKFQIGLCAITQLPSLIPKPILANMNTKIILGIEMALERNAIIESAAQDLTTQNRAIASLDKGEAIITSNFARFATPIKIPLFNDVVNAVKKEQPRMKLAGI